ncbi:general negative regulator of transcription subunit 5 [Marasmius crinis-equi]|uniref:General negative regulator of transcription subunit 5 n=1 Tax=Marasmius crinis-equi TaxID=585013 RepID=A0ABR3F663_9AGAR
MATHAECLNLDYNNFKAFVEVTLSTSALKRILLPTLGYQVRLGRLTQEERDRLVVDGKKIEPEEKNGYFEEGAVSRHHANVWEDPKDKKIYIQDTRSTFGTYLNGKRLDEEGGFSRPYELKTNDILELGDHGYSRGVKLRVVCILNQRDLTTATRAEALNPKMLLVPKPSPHFHTVTSLDGSLEQLYQLVETCQVAYSDCGLVANKGAIGIKKVAYAVLKSHMNELRNARGYTKRLLGATDQKVINRSELYKKWPLVVEEIKRLIEQERELQKLTSISNPILRIWESYGEKDAPEILWLPDHLEELHMQISVADTMSRKQDRKSAEGLANRAIIKDLNARRRRHVGRLEMVMALLIQGILAPEKVEPLHEAVADFVRSNMKPEYKEKRGIYDSVLMLENNSLDEESNASSLEEDDDESSISEGDTDISSLDDLGYSPSSEHSTFTSIESDTVTLVSGGQTTTNNNGDTSTSKSHNTNTKTNHNSHNMNITNHNYHHHHGDDVGLVPGMLEMDNEALVVLVHVLEWDSVAEIVI